MDDKDTFEIIEIQVDPGQKLVRLDQYLLSRLERITRSRLQKYIKAELVEVNGKIVKANYRLRSNDKITFRRPISAINKDGITPQEIPLNVVFEDEYILIINKEAGMVVHPGVGNPDGTLVNAVAYYLTNHELPIMKGNQSDRPGLVHRIDKDTSGLLVLAKSDEAMSNLAKQFYDHSIHRRYHAIVWGSPEPAEGKIEADIGRHPTMRFKNAVLEEGEGGKRAVTHYKVLKDFYYISLVQCELETGRTHQIRVHLDHMGHTLFNDEKYGGNTVKKGTVFTKYKRFVENNFKIMPRHGLHATELGFVHPITGEDMLFKSELPQDMQDCLVRWENYLNTRKNNE